MLFSITGIVLAGLLGTLAMTLFMVLADLVGAARLHPGEFLGTALLGPTRRAYALGLVLHFLIGMLAAAVYAAVFDLMGVPGGIGAGLMLGAVHWLVAMLAYGTVRAWHPGVRHGRLADPGLFARRRGWLESVASLLDHLLFGAIVGGVLGAYLRGTDATARYSFDTWAQPVMAPSLGFLVLVALGVIATIALLVVTTRLEADGATITPTFAAAMPEPEPDRNEPRREAALSETDFGIRGPES